MTILEIVLLVLGVACFVLGFVLPEKSKNALQWEEKKQTRRIDELIESEIDKYKESFAESLNEEIDAYFEKAERGLERVSNEKIMAVNEYGDTVLADINKSHDEAAREEIEALIGTKVFLEIFVKVKEGWRESTIAISNFGYK